MFGGWMVYGEIRGWVAGYVGGWMGAGVHTVF